MLRLRLERQRRGWSQTKVTALTGIATSELSQIERGKVSAFPGWRRRLAAAFGLSESYLFEQVADDAPTSASSVATATVA
jgi:transcriptional regulator with XRE-family HTH domain